MFISTCIKILKNSTDIKFFQIVKKKKFKDSSIIERTKMKKKNLQQVYGYIYASMYNITMCIQDFLLSIKIEILSRLTFTVTLTYKVCTI